MRRESNEGHGLADWRRVLSIQWEVEESWKEGGEEEERTNELESSLLESSDDLQSNKKDEIYQHLILE